MRPKNAATETRSTTRGGRLATILAVTLLASNAVAFASYPDSTIIFSASTKTGEELSRRVMAQEVDLFVPFPLDLYFVARKFINCIRPDLFILIETDFWPNFLHILDKQNIPSLLVNGRISLKSFSRYQRFRFIFLPMFRIFRFISMQTTADAEKMIRLGVEPDRVKALGTPKATDHNRISDPTRGNNAVRVIPSAANGNLPTCLAWHRVTSSCC